MFGLNINIIYGYLQYLMNMIYGYLGNNNNNKRNTERHTNDT